MKKETSKETKALVDYVVNEYKNGTINNGTDLESCLDDLLGPILQALLEAELDNHLEYDKHEKKNVKSQENARNGYCKSKKVKTKYGAVELKTPRDRKGTFTPVVVEKGQSTLTPFEDKCISLYAKGMSYRDIEKIIRDMYKIDLNKDQIAKLINKVNDACNNWRNRRLQKCYAFTFADCLYVPIKDDIISKKKAVYVIIGIGLDGKKDVLGLWIDETESANFWTSVLEDLKKRGVEDILFMSSDGIAGFKGSIDNIFPQTILQRCVVHLARNLYKICPKKIAAQIIKDFKLIYAATSLDDANDKLEDFKSKYSNSYPRVVEKVEDTMQHLEQLYELPSEIRKIIYTTNSVESVNSCLRKVTNGKGAFPSYESVMKVMYLRINDLSEKWNKPIPKWNIILNQLIELYGDRVIKYLNVE